GGAGVERTGESEALASGLGLDPTPAPPTAAAPADEFAQPATTRAVPTTELLDRLLGGDDEPTDEFKPSPTTRAVTTGELVDRMLGKGDAAAGGFSTQPTRRSVSYQELARMAARA